jgi:hypothetical protein
VTALGVVERGGQIGPGEPEKSSPYRLGFALDSAPPPPGVGVRVAAHERRLTALPPGTRAPSPRRRSGR